MKKIGYIIIFIVCTLLCLSTSPTSAHSPFSFIHADCPNTTIFTPNSTYEFNLKSLLTSFYRDIIPIPAGFSTYSKGTIEDLAYGVYLFRGDVSTNDCGECVKNASEEALSRCPQSKDAMMWYDRCMNRYANHPFLGNYDSGGHVILWENILSNVSDPKGHFGDILSNTLNDTATRAAVEDGSGKMYVVGEGNFSAYQTVYVLAQCTPDLSKYKCENCLATCTAQLSMRSRRSSAAVVGAGILYPSCNVRFETFQFYNTRVVAPPPPPPARGKEKKASKVLVVVVVTIGVSVLLFILGLCLLTRRKSIRQLFLQSQ